MSVVQNRPEAGYSIILEINGISVPWQNVDGLIVRESVFSLLPRVSLTFRDVGGFSSSNPIRPGSEIRVSISSNSGEAGNVDYTFRAMKTSTRNIDPNMPNNAVMQVDGILDFPSMFGGLKCAVFNDNFSGVVETVAGITGLEPEIRIKSNDRMKWSCFSQSYMEFLNTSVCHCHISDKECPVVYGTKDGKLVFDGLKRASDSETRISLVFDPLGSLTPATYDANPVNKKGLTESLTNVPYSNWSAIDVNEYMDNFGGGGGITLSYYDEKPVVKKFMGEGSDETTERMVYGIKTLNVHKNYYSAMVNNKMNKNSLFGSCVVLNTGLYGFRPLDKVHVVIPSGNLGDVSEELTGKYLVFQVLTVFNRDAKGEVITASKVG